MNAGSSEPALNSSSNAASSATTPSPSFIHLRLHTEYSLVDGLVRVKSLVKEANAMAMPAVAITDDTNLFALVKFQKAAMENGIKPIYGCDIWLAAEEPDSAPSRLCCLAQSLQGYRNLTKIISLAYLKGQVKGRPMVDRQWLYEYNEGLIVLSGAGEGDIGRALIDGDTDAATTRLAEYQSHFPNRFYLEIQRTGRPNDEQVVHRSIELALQSHCPVVATNDVRFVQRDDFEAHEVRVGIHQGYTLDDDRRVRHYSDQQYLRSPEEMAELFSDIPEALANSVAIARRCSVEVPLGTNFLPDYPIPSGMTMDEYFRQVSKEGLEERLAHILKETDDQAALRLTYEERLTEELGIIIQMGFAGYFLIVMDFIRWAKNNGVPVGPGRGSGAGSLVAYALKITDLDPIEYDLLFERFLNPERVSMPDFDIDFCMEGRDRVIDYVSQTYGRDAVSQIITFGSMAAKAVVRDVGRVQGKSYGFVDRIAKLIPFELGMTLTKALEQEEQLRDLYEQDEEVKELLEMSLKLEGITRNAGKHAGGVVIAPSELTDFVPLYCDDQGHNLVTQFDKDDVESAGLVKFDFLGLRTLTIVDWSVKTIQARAHLNQSEAVDIAHIPLDDSATFELLKSAETTAVFQLESRGMKDLIKRLQPSCFEDIVALVALFRPGPLQSGMVDDFINRKHGRQKVEYPHPDLEPILSTTYGVILYQEQVMQIAQVLAGYSLGEADMLRRAMGKKKPEEMAKQRELFTQGSLARGVSEEQATYIFDLMEKFAGYGFNKSHSAAYALVSYQTAWLKTHFPAEFMAAVLSSDMDNTDKVVMLVEECRQMKLTLLSPDVNYSHYKFTVNDAGEVVYGLGAIKGVGEGPVDVIVSLRSSSQFIDLFDFCQRIDMKKLNKRTMEALIRSGALDQLGKNRAILLATLPVAIQKAEQTKRNAEIGMADLFGDLSGEPNEDIPLEWVDAPNWSEDERLQGEKETLGLYLTGHPIDQYLRELRHFVQSRIVDLQPTQKGRSVTAAGLVVGMRIMKSKRGDRIAFLTLDDKSGRLEVSVFGEVFAEYRPLLVKDALLVIEGEVSLDDYSGNLKMTARKLSGIADAREKHAREMLLYLDHEIVDTKLSLLSQLEEALTPYKEGGCRVIVQYKNSTAKASFELAKQWSIKPEQVLINDLKALLGNSAVKINYN